MSAPAELMLVVSSLCSGRRALEEEPAWEAAEESWGSVRECLNPPPPPPPLSPGAGLPLAVAPATPPPAAGIPGGGGNR